MSLSSIGLAPPGSHGWDDELAFNTQFSSQWDSLVHMQHQPSGLSYNGFQVTQEDLTSAPTTAENHLPTLDHWHSRGGLVGRGVLLDFKAYMDSLSGSGSGSGSPGSPEQEQEQEQEPYHCFDGHRITVEEMEAVARHQGVEFRHGDILIVRTGVTEILEDPQPADLAKLQRVRLSGLHGTEETARWVWNRHFSAVAGDSQSFEAFPPLKPDGTEGSVGDLGKESQSSTLPPLPSYSYSYSYLHKVLPHLMSVVNQQPLP